MKITFIEWCDATSNENAWRTYDEAISWADNEDWRVQNVGWILKETKNYILLSTKRSRETDLLEAQYGSLFKIPKTWIKKRKEIKVNL